MADDINKYLNNRLKYHTASRVAIQTGESQTQAMNVDGHIVTKGQVWAADANQFAYNTDDQKRKNDTVAATLDLIKVFKGGENLKEVPLTGGGKMYTSSSYPAVTLFEDAILSPVDGSDGGGANKYEAYELIGNDGKRVTEWIAPTAVIDSSTGLPTPGYSGLFYYTKSNDDTGWAYVRDMDGGVWAEADGVWEFVPMSGLLTFSDKQVPYDKGVKKLKITAFKYSGDFLNDALSDIRTDIDNVQTATEQNMLACRQFTIPAAEFKTESGYAVKVPGIVFNFFHPATGLAIGDIAYNQEGSTTITIDNWESLPENMKTGNYVALGFTKGDNNMMQIISWSEPGVVG